MATTKNSPVSPAVVALVVGGGAAAWMLWKNSVRIFSHWFFYPSLLFLVLWPLTLFVGLDSRFSRVIWTCCLWWSGLWAIVFVLAMAIPPFSMVAVGSIVAPIIDAGKVSPILAGILHVQIWACAKKLTGSKQEAL
jgi:hypothetical protein